MQDWQFLVQPVWMTKMLKGDSFMQKIYEIVVRHGKQKYCYSDAI